MYDKLIEIRPPRIAQAFVALAVFLHLVTPLRIAVYSNGVLGSVLVAAGFAVMLGGWWLFRVRSTPICPTDTPTVLIADGVYRFTRNPMYLGVVAILLGIALVVGTLPFYVAAAAFFVVMDRLFCPYEEAKLERLFGDRFRAYAGGVRRWL